jgi:hypothetical protein
VVYVRDRFGVSERATFAPLNVSPPPGLSIEEVAGNVTALIAAATATGDVDTVLQV